MDDYIELDEISEDILKELGNIGTGNAMTALAQLTNLPFEPNVPKLRIVNYQEIHSILEEVEEPQVGIVVEIFGELRGVFLFLIEDDFMQIVFEAVLGKKERVLTELDDMEHSLINELGNIMCGAYSRALAQLLDKDISVSVPDLCIDMGGALLSTVLYQFLQVSDHMILIENIFRMGIHSFKGRILFLPEHESLETIIQGLRK